MKIYKIPDHQLHEMLLDASRQGAREALSLIGKGKSHLNKQEAYRVYGRANVKRWIDALLVRPTTDGGHWRLDVMELESAASTSNWKAYEKS